MEFGRKLPDGIVCSLQLWPTSRADRARRAGPSCERTESAPLGKKLLNLSSHVLSLRLTRPVPCAVIITTRRVCSHARRPPSQPC